MLRRSNETTNAQGMNLPGWGLHPLKGRELTGHFSVGVSGNWRLKFTFEGTDAVLVNYLNAGRRVTRGLVPRAERPRDHLARKGAADRGLARCRTRGRGPTVAG